jgi:hypothetical protein
LGTNTNIYIYIYIYYFWGSKILSHRGSESTPSGPEARSPSHPERFPGRQTFDKHSSKIGVQVASEPPEPYSKRWWGATPPTFWGRVWAAPKPPGPRFWPITGSDRTSGSQWPDFKLERPSPTRVPRGQAAPRFRADPVTSGGWRSAGEQPGWGGAGYEGPGHARVPE